MRAASPLLSAFILSSMLYSCAPEGPDQAECSGDKCDQPNLTGEDACELRESDVLSSAHRAFTRDAIRWACSDVEGVNTNNGDDRGQEYCEYFAIVQAPADESGAVPEPAMLGRGKTGILSVDLDTAQIEALEDEESAVVGQCVFTSWHSDIDTPVPACETGECPDIMGFAITEADFAMLDRFNSNSAARELAEACSRAGDSSIEEDFFRGCMLCADSACLAWRRSDPSVCAAAMRLAECGCGIDLDRDGAADGISVASALVPDPSTGRAPRGFPLGTWSGPSELPAGCRYVQLGDDSLTIVSCDLTASDLLNSSSDPKGRCREKYGDNVVVHVPIAADAVVCEPSKGCPAEPWIIER